jgi:hypothetical protein
MGTALCLKDINEKHYEYHATTDTSRINFLQSVVPKAQSVQALELRATLAPFVMTFPSGPYLMDFRKIGYR